MNPLTSPLLTDLYQLTMLCAYDAHGMTDTAVFELFVRRLPPQRNFMMAAGLEQALSYLENLKFGEAELEWVKSSKRFAPGFVDRLAALRFTGDVDAMPEGTVFFHNEPILRVTAPMPEAQLVESRLLNLIHYQSMVASKAARCVLAAPGKLLVDFGLRHAHAAEAGLLAARAAYIAGFAGTATALAAPLYGIPVFGTMAHSFVQAHDDEAQAFADYADVFPNNTTFLIDTYDTEVAAAKLVALAPELQRAGIAVGAVRLDSGDLAVLARHVRQILDAGGLNKTTIFASGNLDEYRLRDLLAAGAPIDGFGIGTALVTSDDAPSLDAVYKLQEYAGKPRRKRSAGKETWPGRKQVCRTYAPQGTFEHDTVALADDPQPGVPLLVPVMRAGKRIAPAETLDAIRARAQRELAALPVHLTALDPATAAYPIHIADKLRELAETLDRHMAQEQLFHI